MEGEGFLSPVRLFDDPVLLSGSRIDLLPKASQVIGDLTLAMRLENDQDLPRGYRIWSDALSNAVAPFYSSDKGREGRAVIEAHADEIWALKGDFELGLRKKRLRKTITEREEFWLTVAYDILETLKSVSLARFVGGVTQSPFLEDVYGVYKAGLYPCGLTRTGKVVAFDARTLTG